jgi:hypothetical protein
MFFGIEQSLQNGGTPHRTGAFNVATLRIGCVPGRPVVCGEVFQPPEIRILMVCKNHKIKGYFSLDNRTRNK